MLSVIVRALINYFFFIIVIFFGLLYGLKFVIWVFDA